MEVSDSLLSWLNTEEVLRGNTSYLNNKHFLSTEDRCLFQNGVHFVPILLRLKPGVSMPPLLEYDSAQSRLSNWNSLIPIFESLGLPINSDLKSVLVAGDIEAVKALLSQLKSIDYNLNHEKGTLHLEYFDPRKSLRESQNSLEFLVLSICQSFKLKPKQSTGLLAENAKFLGVILQNGMKGNFEPVIAWLSCLRDNIEILKKHISQEKPALMLVFDCLLEGTKSKDIECVQNTFEMYILLYRNGTSVKKWFASSGIVQNVMDLLQTYKENDIFFRFLSVYANDSSIFVDEIANNFEAPEYYDVVRYFFKIQNADMYAKEWAIKAIQDYSNNKHRLPCVIFLCELSSNFLDTLGSETLTRMIKIFKNFTNNKASLSKIICLGWLFHILSLLIERRDPLATSVYKILCISLTTFNRVTPIKEFIFENFIRIISEVQSLPVSILIESISANAFQINQYSFNINDFDFYLALARHPRLELKHGILVLDILSRGLTTEPILGRAALIPIKIIAEKFFRIKTVHEFFMKLLPICIKLADTAICLKLYKELINLEDLAFNESLRELCLKLPGTEEILRILGHEIRTVAVYRTTTELDTRDVKSSASALRFLKHKAIENLSKLRKNREEQQSRETLAVFYKQKQEERQRYVLRNTINVRNVELGVAKKSILLNTPYNGHPDSLYNIEEESPFDLKLIYIMFKSYSRLTSYIFNDYCNSGYRSVKEGFEWKKTLTENEVCMMFRDLKINIPSQEIKLVYRKLIARYKTTALSYELFLNFLYQISIRLFSGAYSDLRQYPTAISIKALFELMNLPGRYTQSIGQIINLKSENSEVPEGFKKYKDKIITVSYKIPVENQISKSKKIVLELIDDLFLDQFGFHILSPIISVHTVWKASNNNITDSKLTPGLNLEIAKLSKKYAKDALAICAHLINDLVYSVEAESETLISRNPRPVGSIINNALAHKMQEKRKEMKTIQEQEARRAKRVHVVSLEARKIKEYKLEKEKEFQELQMKSMQDLNTQNKAKKEIYMKKRAMRDKMLSEYHSQKIKDCKSMVQNASHKRTMQRSLSVRKNSVSFSKNFHPEDKEVQQINRTYRLSFKAIVMFFNKGDLTYPEINFNSLALFLSNWNVTPFIIDLISLKRIFQLIVRNKMTHGLYTQELADLLLRVSLLSKEVLEKESKKKLGSYAEHYQCLLDWMNLPVDPKQMTDSLKATKV